LLGKGLDAEDLGEVIIERDSEGQPTVNTGRSEPEQREAAKGKS
jgi:hypothetical protein